MAKVTLYEYDGETAHQSGVDVRWSEMLEVDFDPSEMTFEEALLDSVPAIGKVTFGAGWNAPTRSKSKRSKVYEAVCDDRPLYRAEVEE